MCKKKLEFFGSNKKFWVLLKWCFYHQTKKNSLYNWQRRNKIAFYSIFMVCGNFSLIYQTFELFENYNYFLFFLTRFNIKLYLQTPQNRSSIQASSPVQHKFIFSGELPYQIYWDYITLPKKKNHEAMLVLIQEIISFWLWVLSVIHESEKTMTLPKKRKFKLPKKHYFFSMPKNSSSFSQPNQFYWAVGFYHKEEELKKNK